MNSENAMHDAAFQSLREGMALLGARDDERALQSFHVAADRFRALGYRTGEADALAMAGSIYAQTKRDEEALLAFTEVVHLRDDETGSQQER